MSGTFNKIAMAVGATAILTGAFVAASPVLIGGGAFMLALGARRSFKPDGFGF